MSHEVALIYDVKQNSPNIRKLLKKVQSFNDAVSSFIPPAPAHLHNCNNNSSNNDNASHSTTTTTSIENLSSSNHKTFSIYDSDTTKHPISQISKYGISFSISTTPLLASHSRLDRLDSRNSVIGSVSWILTDENNGGYKVIDESTKTTIGRWKRKTNAVRRRRTTGSETTTDNNNPNNANNYNSIGLTASDPYFSSTFDSKKAHNTPFFSGEAALVSSSTNIQHDKPVWCFIVQGTIIAAIKGYELHILQTPSLHSAMFLDELTNLLRHRRVSSNRTSSTSSSSSQEQPLNSTLSPATTVKASATFSELRSTISPCSWALHHPSINSNVNNGKDQNHQSPPVFTEQNSIAHKGSVTTINRLRFTDAVIMAAMALMLNLDDRAIAGLAHAHKATPPPDNLNSDIDDSSANDDVAPVYTDPLVSSSMSKRKSIFRLPSYIKALNN